MGLRVIRSVQLLTSGSPTWQARAETPHLALPKLPLGPPPVVLLPLALPLRLRMSPVFAVHRPGDSCIAANSLAKRSRENSRGVRLQFRPPNSNRKGAGRKEGRMGSETFLEIILAILLPPVGVFLRYGCGVYFHTHFFLSCFLQFFFHRLPNIIIHLIFSVFLWGFFFVENLDGICRWSSG